MFNYVKDLVVRHFTVLQQKIYFKRNISFVVLTKQQLTTINALAAKASLPDYIVLKRDRNNDVQRFVSFSKVVEGKAYSSAEFVVRYDGYNDFLNSLSEKEPDEAAD